METISSKLFQNGDEVGYLFLDPMDRRYLTGFDSDLGAVLLTPKQSVFLVDSRYSEDAGIRCPSYTVEETLPAQFSDRVVQKLHEEGIRIVSLENRTLRYEEYLRIAAKFDGFEIRHTNGLIEELRAVKTSEEAAKIAVAQSVAERAFERVVSALKVGMSERDVAVELDYQMAKAGADAPSFPTIVAFDANSSKPHAVPDRESRLKNNSVVLMDFGARVDGYCSDTTRTFWFGGKPSEEFVRIFGIVGKAVENFESVAKPGMTCREADALTREWIVANGYGPQYLHSTGHGVGLEIHEFPSVGPKSETVLREGMVITCEPGIYLPGKFGVRTEDLLIVRSDGVESLTKLNKSMTR